MAKLTGYLLVALVGGALVLHGSALVGQAARPAQQPGSSGGPEKQLIDKLKQDTRGHLRLAYHAETGYVRFMGTNPKHAMKQPSVLDLNATPADRALGFLSVYGKLFGVQNPSSELSLMRQKTLADGRAFVRFQQRYQGVPVVGGELVLQIGVDRHIVSANGELLPDLKLDTTPTISAELARQTALQKIAKVHGLPPAGLTSTDPELWIYNPILLGHSSRPESRLVWRMEISPVELRPIRELVLVDAGLGHVTLHFNQIHTAKNRIIYDNANNPSYGIPGNGPVRTEGGAATGITDADLAYDYAGDTYDFFFNEHGRDSLNDAGMDLVSTTRYCPSAASCPYQNAFWNGAQMVYGQGFAAADDVVGHELTHGVTNFSSDLFYYYQSGAINESFSDVWGEFIDQINGSGTDTAAVKWQMGEDIPGIGAIRNMKDPPLFNDPDKMTSGYYYCGEGDNGGVHINSGVNNKAVYLMTDGDTFNGYTVSGLGIARVADLYYEVQTNLLTSGSNYNDLYDALIQASLNLGYSASEQQEIKDALHAVEMNSRPCGDAAEAPVCPAGHIPDYLFLDDLEGGAGNWVVGMNQGSNGWYYTSSYASSGVSHLWGYNQATTADYYVATAGNVTLPANAYLHFKHDWAFEDGTFTRYDGGVVEYSTNSGSSWSDAGPLFTENGYNGTISSSYGNPLGGRSAFTAESHGYTASRLNLNSLAGQNVRFRFRIGTDSSLNARGWFIDDVGIYTCNSAPYFSTSLPNQSVPKNGSKNNAIDLWQHAADQQDADNLLTFALCNSPGAGAGVTIDANRYIDINPATNWEGQTNVCVRVTDTKKSKADSTFSVKTFRLFYFPVILKK